MTKPVVLSWSDDGKTVWTRVGLLLLSRIGLELVSYLFKKLFIFVQEFSCVFITFEALKNGQIPLLKDTYTILSINSDFFFFLSFAVELKK